MLRSGLFSSEEFVGASRGFVLLRLKPGPAESLFGITAAPMSAVADWHGRVVVRDLSLRGDQAGACRRLKSVLDNFDRRKAVKPPPELPTWARQLVQEAGGEQMLRFLARVHPARGRPAKGPAFGDLVKLYESLQREMDLVRFAGNYVTALGTRGAGQGLRPQSRGEESALLRKLTWCVNDRVKFNAIDGYGQFAPLAEVSFFRERAARKTENCRNPNVVLCRCLSGLAQMAKRFEGVRDRETLGQRRALIDSLIWCREVLATEGRNNGACKLALDAIKAIAAAAEAPEAIAAYADAFLAPRVTSEWLAEYTRKFHERNLPWLQQVTGQKIGADRDAWHSWYRRHQTELVYRRKAGRFQVDAAAAKAFRRALER